MRQIRVVVVIAALWLSSSGCPGPQDGEYLELLNSPDGEIEVAFQLDSRGVSSYRVNHKGDAVLESSRLGFEFRESGGLQGSLEVEETSTRTVNEIWEQPWGESRFVTNHFNELVVHLRETSEPGRRLRVVFRAFNDGIGFRYEFPEQEALKDFAIMDELTEFAFAEPHLAWWIPAYQDERYEYLYRNTPLTEFEAAHTPLTLETSSGLTLTLHEANLTDYASMTLRPTRESTLECDLVPWLDGTKVRASTPHMTPWRTLQIAERPEELLDSRLILNLNEPNRIEDTSWIQPGKYVGIWWGMPLPSTGISASTRSRPATSELA
jgi:alpha-glucosidase